MKKIEILIAALLFLTVTSCKNDEWNEHYDSSVSGSIYDGTIMQYVESNPKLSEYARIVKSTGFDKELNSSQTFTVWIPLNGGIDSAMMKDINYNLTHGREKYVLKEFVKNHATRFRKVLSDPQYVTDTYVTLMNTKKCLMNADKTFGTATIVEKNIACKNGVIHIIDKAQPCLPNLFEYIEQQYINYAASHPNINMDSIPTMYGFLSKYNSDSLDLNKSVFRGFDNEGNRIYVDSVMIRNNTILNSFDAPIYEEDSTFSVLLPSIEDYAARYQAAKKMLVYNPVENIADDDPERKTTDSLSNFYAHVFAMTDLFYNDNINKTYLKDSVVSTQYKYYGPTYMHVYQKPYIYNDWSSKYNVVQCSNGKIYEVPAGQYPVSMNDQLYYRLIASAADISNIDLTKNSKGMGLFTNKCNETFSIYTLLYEGGSLGFAYVQATSESNNPTIGIRVKNTLAGKYDVKMVYVPLQIITDVESMNFLSARVWEKDENGQYGEREPEELEDIEGETNHTTRTNCAFDTITFGTVDLKYSYYGTSREGVVVQICSNVTSSKRRNGYSTSFLLSKILLEPHVDKASSAAKSRKR